MGKTRNLKELKEAKPIINIKFFSITETKITKLNKNGARTEIICSVFDVIFHPSTQVQNTLYQGILVSPQFDAFIKTVASPLPDLQQQLNREEWGTFSWPNWWNFANKNANDLSKFQPIMAQNWALSFFLHQFLSQMLKLFSLLPRPSFFFILEYCLFHPTSIPLFCLTRHCGRICDILRSKGSFSFPPPPHLTQTWILVYMPIFMAIGQIER